MLIKCFVFCFLTSVCFVYGKDCIAEIDVEKNCAIFETKNKEKPTFINLSNHKNMIVFYVKGARNAVIQLKDEDEDELYYTVILGANNITEWNANPHLIDNTTSLSSEEWRGFWLEIYFEGRDPEGIKVGRKGSESTLIKYKTYSLMKNITGFWFTTDKNDTVKWGVNCTTDNGNKSYNHPTEKFNCDLFQNYKKSISPFNVNLKNPTDQINVTLEVTGRYINLDTGNEILELNATMNVTWYDERLVWGRYVKKRLGPKTFSSDWVWKPNIILASKAPPYHINFTSDQINVTDQGIVLWNPSLNIGTTGTKNLSSELVTCRMQFSMSFSEIGFNTLVIENPTIISNDSLPNEVINLLDPSQEVGKIVKYAYEFQSPIPVKETFPGDKFAEVLKCRQFSTYNRFEVPKSASRYQTVIKIKSSSVNLSLSDGIFELNGKAKIFWFDERLTWDPQKYTHQYLPSIENDFTWKPNITISHNSTDDFIFEPGKTVISSDGIVMWTPSIKIITKCKIDLKHWPWDSHKCHKITIKINTPGAEFAKPRIEFPETSEWLISGFYSSDLITMRNTTSLEITLQRKITRFQKLLFFQFIVTSLTMLCSFGISPLRRGKIILNIASFSLLTLFYITLVWSAPTTWSEPNLLNDYNVLLVIGTLSNLLSMYLSLLVSKSRNSCLPKYILSIIDNRFVRLALFLTLQKEPKNYPDYQNDQHMEILRAGTIGEDESDQDETENSKKKVFRRDWLKVAVVCDHLVFLVSCAFIVKIFLAYFQPILKELEFLPIF